MGKSAVDILISATDNASRVFQQVAGSLGDVKGNMEKASGASKVLLGAVTGAGVAGAVAFSSFDDSMRRVEATMGGKLGNTVQEVAKNTESLRDKAKEMGRTTSFSAQEAAQAMEKLALAGWDTDQVMAGLQPSLNLASIGNMDLATSADILTDTMASFQMKAGEATKAADIFALTASSTNTDVNQLGEAMKYAGGMANSAGMDLAETNAILGYFANTGMKGSMAGTTFASMLRDLTKNAKDGSVAIGDQSIAIYDAQGNMRGLADIMGDVEKATAGMSDEQRDSALSSVFQVEAMKGVNSILSQGSDGLQTLIGNLRDSSGASQEMANHIEGGLGGAFRSAWSAIQGVAIQLGQVMAPAIEAGTRAIASIVNKVTDWLESSNQVGPVLAIIGTAILAGLVPAFYALGAAIWTATAPLLPFIAIGIAVGALAVLIYKKWEPIKQFFINTFGGMFEAFSNFFMGIWTLIQPILMMVVNYIKEKLDMIKQFWNENGQMILQAVQNVWNVIVTVITTVLNVILAIFKFIFPAIQFVVELVWDTIKTIIDGALKVILSVIQIFAALFTGNWSALWEGIKGLLSGALQLIWGLVQMFFGGKIIGVIGKFAGKAVGFIGKMASQFISKITGMASKVMSSISGLVSKAISAVKGWVSKMVGFIDDMVYKFIGKVAKLNTDMGLAMARMWEALKGLAKKGVEAMVTAIKNMGKSFLSAGKGLIEAFIKGIKSTISGAPKALAGGLKKLRNLLPFSPAKEGPLSDLDKSGESFFPTFVGGMMKGVSPMVRNAEKGMSELSDTLDKEAEGMMLESFTGGKQKIRVVHEHKHTGSVNVNGDTSRETVRMTGQSLKEQTEDTFMSDFRRSVRSN